MEILYFDTKIVVCIKPVGLDAEKQLPEALKKQLGGEIFPLHRLDKNVGGLMLYARTQQSAAQFSQMIREGALCKEYVALVHGMPPEQGVWEDLLFKDSRRNKVFVVDRPRAGVKAAKLEFTRLRSGERSLVRIRLHTGRSHQIRVQFASRGFPLVGDHKYGSRAPETAPMLFSCCLRFPYEGQERVWEAMPPWQKDF